VTRFLETSPPHVDPGGPFSRRSFLLGAAAVAAGLAGCTGSGDADEATSPTGDAPVAQPPECDALAGSSGNLLWESAIASGLVYGSSTATWQISDASYRRLFDRQAAMLFTEDDLLWYRLKPTPQAELDFRYGDRIVGFAERNGMLVLGAHLVWDEGFGEGWTDDDLWGLDSQAASDLLYGTVDTVVDHYRGRVAAWIVANEVLDGSGMRDDVPWMETIGPSYVPESFAIVRERDPDAMLLLNDYGFETDEDTTLAADKRAATLAYLDQLIGEGVPVDALGVQAHLQAETFLDTFDPEGYRSFLSDVADRDLRILVTEMDVLDGGLPAEPGPRDAAVADVYATYLDVVLDEPAVVALTTFGLSDRYTWLQEDYPRSDGAPRRPLPYDEQLRPKPAFDALRSGLRAAPGREAAWVPPRCSSG
jgi:endo-1,4-beta-xylanase